MIFILISFFMVTVAAAFIIVPLWRKSVPAADVTGNAGLRAHNRQLSELDNDLENGTLAEADYASALRDLETEQHLNRSGVTVSPVREGHRRTLGIIIAALLFVVAGALYWRIGNWRVGIEGVNAASRTSVINMVQQLDTRLHTTDGNDLQGWLMLGHAYVLMERYPDAVAALDHARKLTNNENAEVLSAYAEAVTLADPDHFMQRAAPLFEDVLKLDPADQKALWYGGLAASQRGDNKLAVTRWRTLLKQGLPEKYSAVVTQYIEQAGGTAAMTTDSGAATTTVIHLHVSLSPAFKNKVTANDTVFIFAQAEAGQGSGPPLAVRRFHVRDLPLSTTLSDQDAMIAGRNLSDFNTVQLVARISRDGSPLVRPGEPVGSVTWKRNASTKRVDISIASLTR